MPNDPTKPDIDPADDVETVFEMNRLIGWMLGQLEVNGLITVGDWNEGVATVTRRKRAAKATLEGQATIDTVLGE